MTDSFVNPDPCGPAANAKKMSAIPPLPSWARSRYLPNVDCAMTNHQQKGAVRACSWNAGRAGDLPVAPHAGPASSLAQAAVLTVRREVDLAPVGSEVVAVAERRIARTDGAGAAAAGALPVRS